MHSTIAKSVDKRTCTFVICHLFRQTHSHRSGSISAKARSPFLTLKSNFTYILNSILEKQLVFGTSPFSEIQKSLQEHATGYNAAVSTLMNILKIDRKFAKSIVEDNEQFTFMTCRSITDNYNMLRFAGMSLPNMINNSIILTEESYTLQNKITTLQKFVDDINYGIPLLFHSEKDLNQFVYSTQEITYDNPVRNSVKLYVQHWNVHNEELYQLLSKYMYFLIQHRKNTVDVIKLLLDNKVTVKSLLRSRWNVLININEAKKRLKECSQFGLLSVEPWILNSSDAEFKRRIQMKNCKSFKGYRQIVKYLSQNSGYSTELVDTRISALCNVKFSDLENVKNISNLIIKEGYEWHDLIWDIKVLSLSEKLIADRFSKLKSINYKSPFLDFLLLSNEDFVNFVNNCKN